MRARLASGAARLRIIMLINSKGLIKPAKRASWPCGAGMPCVGPQRWSTLRRHDRRGWNRKRCRPTVFDRRRESSLESRSPSQFFRLSPNEIARTDPPRVCYPGEIGLGNVPIVDHSDGVPHKHKL